MWQLTTDTLRYAPDVEGAAVIYQIASGDTHLLSAQAGRIILHLQTAALSTEALQQYLDDGQNPAALQSQQPLEATLTELQQLDLITHITA